MGRCGNVNWTLLSFVHEELSVNEFQIDELRCVVQMCRYHKFWGVFLSLGTVHTARCRKAWASYEIINFQACCIMPTVEIWLMGNTEPQELVFPTDWDDPDVWLLTPGRGDLGETRRTPHISPARASGLKPHPRHGSHSISPIPSVSHEFLRVRFLLDMERA